MDMPDLLARAGEPLHPDLTPHLIEGTALGTVLKHPLVFGIPYSPHWVPLYNDIYAAKREAIDTALAAGDVHGFIWAHERPHRFDALRQALAEGWHTDDQDRWEDVRMVWMDSENVWQNLDAWAEVWDLPGAHAAMTDDDREAYDALPDTVTVYRGCVAGLNEDGLSWTLSQERATWFARRFVTAADVADGEEPVVAVATVPKATIRAVLLGRREEEVIVPLDGYTFDHYVEVDVTGL